MECPICDHSGTIMERSEVRYFDVRGIGSVVVKDYRSSVCLHCHISFVTGIQSKHNDRNKEPVLFYPRLNRRV